MPRQRTVQRSLARTEIIANRGRHRWSKAIMAYHARPPAMPSALLEIRGLSRHLGAAPWRAAIWLMLALALPAWAGAALDTSYAVQASATVQSSPPQITLSWTTGPLSAGTTGYAVSRKDADATAWTPLISLPATTTSYTDTNVTAGHLYEYQIVRQSPLLTAYGYLASGIDLPVVDSRGKVILVVDSS